MWEKILKKEPPISPQEKRDLKQIKNANRLFDISQKMLIDGANFINTIHPLIKRLPLAAIFPTLRGTGIGPSLKNSVAVVSDMMLRLATKRDSAKQDKLKQKIKEINDKIGRSE